VNAQDTEIRIANSDTSIYSPSDKGKVLVAGIFSECRGCASIYNIQDFTEITDSVMVFKGKQILPREDNRNVKGGNRNVKFIYELTGNPGVVVIRLRKHDKTIFEHTVIVR
jgi:hypothetical protein